MLFHLLAPLNGISNDSYIDYFLLGVLTTLVVATIVYFLDKKYLKKRKRFIYSLAIIFSFCFLITYLDIDNYIYNQIVSSNFIKENYVDPENVELEFPDKMKN